MLLDGCHNLIFAKIIAPIGRLYNPDLIIVSAGYDAYAEDPLAGMDVSPAGFAGITRTIVSLAEEVCNGKIIFVLEGGYHLKGLQACVLKTLDEMTGHTIPAKTWKGSELFEVIRSKSKMHFSPFWKIPW